jgi:hypothetical protein
VGERYVLEEMLGTFISGPKPSMALPLTNEQDSGTSSGVRSVGISIGTAVTS